MYVFVKEIYLEWLENYFFYDEFVVFNHQNPGKPYSVSCVGLP